MLRITRQDDGNSTLLKLEGTLREPWLAVFSQDVAQVLSTGNRLKLDLSQVTFADVAGIALIKQLLDQGAHLAKCSGFVAASLGLEKP